MDCVRSVHVKLASMCAAHVFECFDCVLKPKLLSGWWLMPLASQYLLLVLYNVQDYIKMLFRVTC